MNPFIGEIRLFAGNFPPRDWAFCDGSLLPIPQYTALFSILGTVYGGDGQTTFALPDLRGKATIHQGQGTGLSQRTLGESGGAATVTLQHNEMPSHAHLPKCVNANSNQKNPIENTWANMGALPIFPNAYSTSINTQMNSAALMPTGSSQPHNNRQPYLGLNFIIALHGVFPPHS